MSHIDFRQLQCFHKVATLGSFTRAASSLFVTQSAVSHSVKDLERFVGTSLFVRGRKLVLTEMGKLLLSYTERIFTIASELEANITEIKSGKKGFVRFGAIESVLLTFGPDLMCSYPQAEFTYQKGTSVELENLVAKEELHYAFLSRPSHIHGLRSTLLQRFPHVLVGRKKMKGKELKKALSELPIFVPGFWLRDLMSQEPYFEEHFPKSTFEETSNCLTVLSEMVLRGLGLGVLPSFFARRGLLTLKSLERPTAELYVVRRAAPLLPAAENFMAHVQSFFQELP